MKYLPLIIISFLIISITSSCKKDENVEQQICESGPGGKVDLAVNVLHHDSLIPGAVVYIKYNQTEFPGTDPSKYSTVAMTGTSGQETGHVHLEDMNCGRYYFYAEGYDANVNDSVFGGIPVTITQREGTYTVNIPVTE